MKAISSSIVVAQWSPLKLNNDVYVSHGSLVEKLQRETYVDACVREILNRKIIKYNCIMCTFMYDP